MNKKNILHVIDSLVIGGAETLLINTVNSLPNYNNHIATLLPINDFEDKLTCKNITCLNFTKRTRILTIALKLRQIIKENKIDIIHCHLFWATLVARIACIGLDVKFIFSLHTVMSKDSFNNSKLMLWVEKLTYTNKQIVIGVSNTVLKDYNDSVGIKGESHVLYNFIDNSFFISQKKHERVNNNIIKLVAVGNIKPVKNYEYLIEVFKQIDNSKFSLDIYGEGEKKEVLKKEVSKHNLNIEFKGSSSKINSILPLYDAYVMPSLHEGFGIAPLEAMAISLPVLLSDIDVFREIANDEALFFNPTNPDDLRNILNKFANDEIDTIKMIRKGKARAALISKKEDYLKKLNAIYLD